jgi:probable Rubsico expression protein CbbX
MVKEVGESGVNLRAAFLESGIGEVLEAFNCRLVGLNDVKSRVREVAMFILLQLVRKRMGLQNSSVQIGSNMCFTGASGTGKTLVARRFASLLYKLGVVPKGHLVVAGREDLVGQYIGHTAPKAKAVFKKAEGGVLFLDDAYNLYKRGNPRDYGSEVIEILLQYMERFRDSLVVVFAGYKNYMDAFFLKNPGLASRVLRHIDFPNYTVIELVLIAFLVCEEKQYMLDQEAVLALWEWVSKRRNEPYFANARTVENKVVDAIVAHSARLFASGSLHGVLGGLENGFVVTLKACDFSEKGLFLDCSSVVDAKMFSHK